MTTLKQLLDAPLEEVLAEYPPSNMGRVEEEMASLPAWETMTLDSYMCTWGANPEDAPDLTNIEFEGINPFTVLSKFYVKR